MNLDKLTTSQQKVFYLPVKGNTNAAIAHALGCAEKTVKGHITQIFQVTGCRNCRQLIASYYIQVAPQENRKT